MLVTKHFHMPAMVAALSCSQDDVCYAIDAIPWTFLECLLAGCMVSFRCWRNFGMVTPDGIRRQNTLLDDEPIWCMKIGRMHLLACTVCIMQTSNARMTRAKPDSNFKIKSTEKRLDAGPLLRLSCSQSDEEPMPLKLTVAAPVVGNPALQESVGAPAKLYQSAAHQSYNSGWAEIVRISSLRQQKKKNALLRSCCFSCFIH